MSERKNIKPPRLAEKLFAWYCSRALVEDLYGDMEEIFYHNLTRMGPLRAKAAYWMQIISLMFSYAIKQRKKQSAYHTFSTSLFNPSMLKNYFLIAVRNLSKHKMFTIINVFGLAVGMSIGLLFISMISFVYTYDNFHENKDRIFRIVSLTKDNVRNMELASTPQSVGEEIRQDLPAIEKVVRINSTLGREVIIGEDKKTQLNGHFVDPEFFEVFSFPLIKGDLITSHSKPNSLLLTESAARKLFGKTDALGNVVKMDFAEFEVTGILKDPPINSHLQFEMIAPYQAYTDLSPAGSYRIQESDIDFFNNYVYIMMPEQHDAGAVQRYLDLASKKLNAKNQQFTTKLELQAFNDIAHGRELSNAIGPEWGTTGFIIFFVLTLLILLPACFNYATISISRALKRMKEIGLRKVVGGQRNQIFVQFIMETVVITLIALLLSYYLFFLVRTEFESMIVEPLDLTPSITTLIYFVLFALFVGFAAGFVPAMYFSRLNPIQALKAKATGGKAKFTFRKVLIAGQFTLSLGFIMAVVVVLSQYRYIMNFDFGFDQANLLDVELQGAKPQVIKNEFEKISSVQRISMSSHVMGTSSSGREMVSILEMSDSVEAFQMSVDENYLANLGLTLIAGKNFGDNETPNRKNIIVNETFAGRFNKANIRDVIDEPVTILGKEYYVVGVVKDFHYMSLQEPIREFYFNYDAENFRYANVKLQSKDMFGDLSQMEDIWKSLGNENKFKAEFFDDEIKDTYAFYFTMVKLCGSLGVLAITISCLGLLGMVVFTVENRIKEIGIRKVMGSTAAQITILLSKDYLKLLVIAAIIAIPVTYWIMDLYYENSQAYRGTIGAIEILISLLIMIVLGGVTIFSQTFKAAKANPVDTLRYE